MSPGLLPPEHVPLPTDEEKKAFLVGLRKIFPKSAILATCFPKPRDDSSVPRRLPRTVTSLYHPRYKELSQTVLLKECERVFNEELKVTSKESRYLAESTRLQTQSQTWFEHRRGRLTASKFGAICHTSVTKPSRSLVAQILQLSPMPKSAALSWGIEHEKTAREQYLAIQEKQHTSFKLEATGLCVNPSFPHLGASPDGLISCNCCGNGVLEIKCPYSVRHTTPDQASYLLSTDDGYKLSEKHDYYYQIQGQLGILQRQRCDFVCWTPHGIHIEQIIYDPSFFSNICCKLQSFFVLVVLPRVLCGAEKENTCHPSETTGVFCYCRKGEVGKMVLCDNPSCKYGWFHFSCINLKSAPEGAWFCPDCKK